MSNIYVEQEDDGTYVATQNHRTVATGNTQRQTIDRARRTKPDAFFCCFAKLLKIRSRIK